jgi:uncharacterized 2Fe-2S/4Fe-4S cluster protein (DUF4445 family)
MSDLVRIELQPLGKTILVPKGEAIQDALFAQGVEFPCGGRARCRGCKIRVVGGESPITDEERRQLTPGELADGWRLGCCTRPSGDLKIALAQWETPILADHASVQSFLPRPGLGVAVDLGTTTVVGQLLDLQSGRVLGSRLALNTQARHGADVMSRIDFALEEQGRAQLCTQIREQIGLMIASLLAEVPGGDRELRSVVVVGNTVMHHLFCGLSVAPLAHTPFEPKEAGLQTFGAGQLGWQLPGNPEICFLPCLGGFVGSDILAGVLATRLHQQEDLCALVDLGTNGEIVVGNRHRLLCASTAAGPAFEGARISMGMRAATGAVSAVSLRAAHFHCQVIGHTEPRGLCGSGLVDAVACALQLGQIQPNGRLAQGKCIPLAGRVTLTQADVRELQLAKGAIAAGIRLLVKSWGATLADVARVHLAGAFGNYINRNSARQIGLLEFPLERVEPAGNTALLGAKLALLGGPEPRLHYGSILDRQTHICLHEDPDFQEMYADLMAFPAPAQCGPVTCEQ